MSTTSPIVLQAAFETSMTPPRAPDTGHSKVDVATSAPHGPSVKVRSPPAATAIDAQAEALLEGGMYLQYMATSPSSATDCARVRAPLGTGTVKCVCAEAWRPKARARSAVRYFRVFMFIAPSDQRGGHVAARGFQFPHRGHVGVPARLVVGDVVRRALRQQPDVSVL